MVWEDQNLVQDLVQGQDLVQDLVVWEDQDLV